MQSIPRFVASACACACLLLLLAACAASVRAVPAQLAPLPSGSSAREMTIAAPVLIELSTGYRRQLAAGSRWREAGSVREGTVYMPVGTVFTIEGRDVHEAYLVVRDGFLQGFYLPAEGRYSPLQQPISIDTGGRK
jgi:hypothetical protein